MAPKRSIQMKRQSKLDFSPASASSSGAHNLSPHVRSRAPADKLESSSSRPQKKRKIDFAIVRGTRESSGSSSDVPLDRSHGFSTPNKSFHADLGSARNRTEDKSMREGMPVLSRKNGMFGSSDNEILDTSTSSSGTDDPQRQPIDLTPRKKSKKGGKNIQGAKSELQHSVPGRSRLRRKIVSESEEEDEELEERIQLSKRKGRHARSSQSNALLTHRKKASVLEVLSDSDDSDTMPDTSPPPKRGRRPAERRERSDSFEVPDDAVDGEDGSTDDDDIAPRSTRKRQNVQEISDDENVEEEESQEEEPRSTARRLIRKKGLGRNRQEEEDLNADLDFLQSSPPADKGRLRSTNEKPLNERQKALEALKKRRASSQAEPASSAVSRGQKLIVPSDTESELEIIQEGKEDSLRSLGEEASDEVEEDSVVGEGSQGPGALEVFRENEHDADFINDDDEGLLGEPADLTSIPLQFTSLSRSKTKDLFKYAVEWMVQKKINPAFSSADEIYDLTFRKLDDEVNTLANSKYSSSAWTVDFTRALRARPEIIVDEISRSERMVMEPHCEACNRKTHPATFNIFLSGKPYNKESLEPLADDSDSSDSDTDSAISSTGSETCLNNEKPTFDAQGERIPPESKIFTLGSTCKANAQMAHTLHHWRYHLNSWVVDYLVRTGHCTPQKLVDRDQWSSRKREKYANKVVDEMERIGEVRKLYRLYKEQVDFALEVSTEYKSGWGRRR